MNRFGSWNNAVREAGLQTRGELSEQDLIEDLQRVADTVDGYIKMSEYNDIGSYDADTYSRRFNGWINALEAAGLPSAPERDRKPVHSDDDLIEELERLADELDSTPTFDEMNEQGEYSAGTFVNRFGSWSEAVEAAGLEPNR